MKISYQSAAVVAILGLVAACGGGGGSSPSALDVLSNKISSALNAFNSASPLSSMQFSDLFDDNYTDEGLSLTDIKNNTTADIAAKDSVDGFPSGTLSNIKIANCDSKNICDMTADLTNTDAETTTVTFCFYEALRHEINI